MGSVAITSGFTGIPTATTGHQSVHNSHQNIIGSAHPLVLLVHISHSLGQCTSPHIPFACAHLLTFPLPVHSSSHSLCLCISPHILFACAHLLTFPLPVYISSHSLCLCISPHIPFACADVLSEHLFRFYYDPFYKLGCLHTFVSV